MQQARRYAEMLGLKLADATNGADIVECDYFTGKDTKRPDFPTPDELWRGEVFAPVMADGLNNGIR